MEGTAGRGFASFIGFSEESGTLRHQAGIRKSFFDIIAFQIDIRINLCVTPLFRWSRSKPTS